MPLHEFIMIVEGPDLQDDGVIDALFEAGCDDALIGRTDCTQYLDFGREADTFEEAVFSAIADVESVAGVKVVRLADIGLLSMSDIATRTGRTRESVRLLIAGKRGPGGFPPPVTDPRRRNRMWWSDEVYRWFSESLGEQVEHWESHVIAAVNAGLEFRRRLLGVEAPHQVRLKSLVGV